MSRMTSFDWYTFSKLNQNALDIQEFSKLIKTAHMGNQLNRVPNSLRQKLLIFFQIASAYIKQQYEEYVVNVQNLKFEKKIINQKMASMKQELQSSMNKINTDKIVIQEKRKIFNKMKEKLKKKQQQKTKKQTTNNEKNIQIYFCPFCTRKDFSSRDDYTFHVFKAHANYLGEVNSNQSQSQQSIGSVNSQVKDLLLSLKDKEIQLVQIMMNKKKQIQQMQLEYAYNTGLRNIQSQPDFMERKSQYLTNYGNNRSQKNKHFDQESSQQLKGESQYLFYQPQAKAELQYNQKYPENQHGQRIQRQNKNIPIVNTMSIQSEQILKRRQRQKNGYYNIFIQQIAVSQSDVSISPQKQTLQNKYNKINQKQINSWAPQQKNKKIYQQQVAHKNFSYQVSMPSEKINPPQVQQIQSKLFNFTHNIDMKKDMQPFQNSNMKSDRKYETFYAPTKSNISGINIEDAHIFNSGPLMDDIGDGSDYEDYFSSSKNNKMNESQDEVLDQSIRIVKKLNDHTKILKQHKGTPSNANVKTSNQNNYAISLKQNQNNLSANSVNQSSNQSNILQYSKDKLFLQVSNSKQKSSDLIDLSNSFQKRQLQSSKNNDETINLSDLKLSKLEKQREKLKQQNQNANKQIDEQISIRAPERINMKKYQHHHNLLQQFKREPDLEQIQKLKQKSYQSMQRTEKPRNSASIIKMPSNVELMKTNPGVLDQFFYK